MNTIEMWDICIKFLWDQKYVDSLASFLKERGVRTILDCGGGTGFPLIDLAKRGFAASYSDVDPIAIGIFKKKCRENNLKIPVYASNWLNLSKNVLRKFDALMCRANSLGYMDSWNGGPVTPATKINIQTALNEFRKLLSQGGILYVDVAREEDFKKVRLAEDLGEKIIDDTKISLRWELEHDTKKKIRFWRISLKKGGRLYKFERQSYLLRHSELEKMLKKAGFARIEKIVPEKGFYVTFIASI